MALALLDTKESDYCCNKARKDAGIGGEGSKRESLLLFIWEGSKSALFEMQYLLSKLNIYMTKRDKISYLNNQYVNWERQLFIWL